MSLSFTDHTVVVTGAGGGLGRAYSLLFASRGANIVINDSNPDAAQKVADDVIKAGGKAIVNTSSVTDGTAVIQSALDAFGGVTILINNAETLGDKEFKSMTDQDWEQVYSVLLKGAFSCTRAAWPHFRKQKFGRVINTTSAAGLYGNFGRANYSAAQMGLVAFTKTLCQEGAKYGIHSTCIGLEAASEMAKSVSTVDLFIKIKSEFIAPFVMAVSHPDGPDASGKVFELGDSFIAELRWERSHGVVFKSDASFTPSAVKVKWSDVVNFTDPYHPESLGDIDFADILETAASAPPNPQATPEVRFDGMTVIITGAGAGLGRAYAHMYGRLGANVLVNDVSEKGANTVVAEVQQAGGMAAAVICSAEAGDTIVKVALQKFGGVHILVANAGVLRDSSFMTMSEQQWDTVMAVHLRGTYKCAKAVWPVFQKQKYGRIITTSSQVGIYGNFGQANYSAAKSAIIGLTRTLAIEGKQDNILVNAIAPVAGTAMTMTVWPQEQVDAFKPSFIAPLVGYLTSEDNKETTGDLFEVLGGWMGQTRWQRAGGYNYPANRTLTPEDVLSEWDTITNFDDGRATNPTNFMESFNQVCPTAPKALMKMRANLNQVSEVKTKL